MYYIFIKNLKDRAGPFEIGDIFSHKLDTQLVLQLGNLSLDYWLFVVLMKCVLTSKRSFHCILPMIENDFPCKGFTRGWVDRLVNRWKDFWDWWILPPIVSLIDPHHDKLFQSQGYKKVFMRTFNNISVKIVKGTVLTFHSHIQG